MYLLLDRHVTGFHCTWQTQTPWSSRSQGLGIPTSPPSSEAFSSHPWDNGLFPIWQDPTGLTMNGNRNDVWSLWFWCMVFWMGFKPHISTGHEFKICFHKILWFFDVPCSSKASAKASVTMANQIYAKIGTPHQQNWSSMFWEPINLKQPPVSRTADGQNQSFVDRIPIDIGAIPTWWCEHQDTDCRFSAK